MPPNSPAMVRMSWSPTWRKSSSWPPPEAAPADDGQAPPPRFKAWSRRRTTVGVIQELRAEKALSALRQLAAPQARVIRSGRTLVLDAAEVVPGDLALTHGLPGVALGAEPADPKAMSRGPRAPDEHVLGGGLWQRIAWTGALISLVVLAVGVWAERTGAPWQTMTFIVLGMAQLGVAMALRRPAMPGSRRVRFLDFAVAGAAIAQLLPLVFAPLRNLLGLDTLTLAQLGVALAVAAVPGIAVRLLRRFRPGRRSLAVHRSRRV